METHFSAQQLEQTANRTSEREIRRCVHCGFCTATCPTYVLLGDELDSPRGRIYLMRNMLEQQSTPSPEVVKHIDRCLSCLSCVTTCPSGVNYMHLIDHARHYIESHYRRPWRERWLRTLLAMVLPDRRRLRWALRLAQWTRPLARRLARAADWRSLQAMLDLVPTAPLPAAPAMASAVAAPTPHGIRGRVALLQGCAEPVLRPAIRAAASRVLQRIGIEVVGIADESCCGALVHHMGRESQALAQARRNVDAWSAEIDAHGLDAILVTASGCGTQLKNYGFLLADDTRYADKARRIAALVQDISEFLTDRGLPPLKSDAPHGASRRVRVAYQAACSLQHGQAVRDPPKRLLASAGFEVLEPAEAHLCCGSAGTYNVLQPTLAGALRERKLANLAVLQPDVIASGNIGCITQMAAGTELPVVHTIELLDWATGGPTPTSAARVQPSTT
jgi:glycolate oxidase iron-sulfur subunit